MHKIYNILGPHAVPAKIFSASKEIPSCLSNVGILGSGAICKCLKLAAIFSQTSVFCLRLNFIHHAADNLVHI